MKSKDYALLRLKQMKSKIASSTSENELEVYALSFYSAARREVARNLHTSPRMLHYLASDEDDTVVESVARNPMTNGETLRFLSKHDSVYVRIFVAGHTNTPSHVLASMAKNDVDAQVVRTVAHNKNTPQEVRFAVFLEHPEWAR